jgi:hypothetical protein
MESQDNIVINYLVLDMIEQLEFNAPTGETAKFHTSRFGFAGFIPVFYTEKGAEEYAQKIEDEGRSRPQIVAIKTQRNGPADAGEEE